MTKNQNWKWKELEWNNPEEQDYYKEGTGVKREQMIEFLTDYYGKDKILNSSDAYGLPTIILGESNYIDESEDTHHYLTNIGVFGSDMKKFKKYGWELAGVHPVFQEYKDGKRLVALQIGFHEVY